MKKTMLVIICFLIVAGSLSAGVCAEPDSGRTFRWLNPLPQGNTLFSVFGFSKDHFFTGGMRNMLEYTNGGYEHSSIPLYDPWILDIWGFSPSDIYAVGIHNLSLWHQYKGMILHYDGTVWTETFSGINARLNAVFGAAGQPVYVVGSGGVLLGKTGNEWYELESGTNRDLYSGILFPDGNGFIAGDGIVLRRTNEGEWISETLPVKTGFRAVWGPSPDSVYVCGEFGVLLHFNGHEWTQVDNPFSHHLLDIQGIDDKNVYAVGASGILLHIADHTIQNSWNTGHRSLHSVSVFEEGYLKIAGDAGEIWTFSDGTITSDVTGIRNTINGVWGSSPGNVFMVGDWGVILHWNGTSLESMQSGTSRHLTRVTGTSPDSVFAVGHWGTVLRYSEGTWSDMYCPTDAKLVGIWAASENDVFALGENGETWHYNGVAWNRIHSFSTSTFYGIWGFAPNDVYISGGFLTGGFWTDPLLIHYNGETWNEIDISFLSGTIKDVRGSDPDHLYIIAHDPDNHLLDLAIRSSSGDWQTVNLSWQSYMYPNRIIGSSAGNVYILGEYGGSSMIWRFDGESIFRVDEWIGGDSKDAWLYDDNRLFSVGPNGQVLASGNIDPDPHPDCDWFGTRLEISQNDLYRSGDTFWLKCRVCADSALSDVPLAVLLSVYGEFWFWPSWTQAFDMMIMDFEQGLTPFYCLDPIEWPNVEGHVTGLKFYAAMLTPEMNNITGEFGYVEFGYTDTAR